MKYPEWYTHDKQRLDARYEIIHELIDYMDKHGIYKDFELDCPECFEQIEKMVKGKL